MTITNTEAKKYVPNVQCAKLLRDKNHPYTIISNDKSSFAWDSELSLAGIGLMCKVQALNQWNFSVAGFSTLVKDGETKISSVIAELIEHNYLIVKRLRDKLGRYISYSYHFFESSKECLEYKKKIEETEAQEAQMRAKAKANAKTKSNTPIKQIEPPNTTTIQSENIKTPETEIITILKRNIAETTQEFAEKTANYLSSAISKGIISLNTVMDKLEAIISKEHSLDTFMHTLEEKCTEALGKLKYPHAKYNYIRKTMVNILREYELESPEPTQPVQQSSKKQADTSQTEETMPKTLSFRELLTQLHCSLPKKYANEEYYGISFDSAEKFWSSFDVDEDTHEEISECIIPENLRHNPENMENALKFLMGWNTLESGEFKSFSEYAISCLAEVLQTGKCCREKVNYHNLISYLNYINWGGKDEYERETNEESIYDFMESFFAYYCKKIEEYPPSSNKKGYLTRMLVNYLNGEYQASHAYLHAGLKNLNGKSQTKSQEYYAYLRNTNHNYDEDYAYFQRNTSYNYDENDENFEEYLREYEKRHMS